MANLYKKSFDDADEVKSPDIDVGFYSRKREINEESSFSVLG